MSTRKGPRCSTAMACSGSIATWSSGYRGRQVMLSTLSCHSWASSCDKTGSASYPSRVPGGGSFAASRDFRRCFSGGSATCTACAKSSSKGSTACSGISGAMSVISKAPASASPGAGANDLATPAASRPGSALGGASAAGKDSSSRAACSSREGACGTDKANASCSSGAAWSCSKAPSSRGAWVQSKASDSWTLARSKSSVRASTRCFFAAGSFAARLSSQEHCCENMRTMRSQSAKRQRARSLLITQNPLIIVPYTRRVRGLPLSGP
mmetsp:Transcript_86306/g.268507  ORF Transcript_86306/g.268507 Transcript_86306/m.268507 type:complete len:268 (-) Transcript_86306:96-899(-)